MKNRFRKLRKKIVEFFKYHYHIDHKKIEFIVLLVIFIIPLGFIIFNLLDVSFEEKLAFFSFVSFFFLVVFAMFVKEL